MTNSTDYIPLSTDKTNPGICPHLTICTRCGADTNAITLGELWKAKYQNQYVYFYRKDRRAVEQKLNHQFKSISRVNEYEKVPYGLCDNCETELNQFKTVVEAGGLYFECEACHRSGVIKSNNYTKAIREKHNILAPNPLGVRFDSCNQHRFGE